MYDSRYPPEIEAQRTISDPNHPDDPGVVVGFYGRDTVYGRDVLVQKSEATPVINGNDLAFGVRLAELDTPARGDEPLVILSDYGVFIYEVETVVNAPMTTFDITDNYALTLPAVSRGDGYDFNPSEVEVIAADGG